ARLSAQFYGVRRVRFGFDDQSRDRSRQPVGSPQSGGGPTADRSGQERRACSGGLPATGGIGPESPAIPEIHPIYPQRLRELNAVDFGDLLLLVHQLFHLHPDVLERWRGRFNYLLVDEYQDTNRVQYLLLRALAAGKDNICVVGDEDQSIYRWRGADIRN